MSFQVKTVFPKEEVQPGNQKQIETKKTEFDAKVETPALIDLYRKYLNAGYDVNVKFTADDQTEEFDPFKIGASLAQAGIDYQATLKLKFQGVYDSAQSIATLIEAAGYDYNVGVTLKVNEKSSVNFKHADTWNQPEGKDALYKITPKAKATNVDELKGLYNQLQAQQCDVEIDIKPKKKSTDDDEADFASQVAAYPEHTLVTLTLKESED